MHLKLAQKTGHELIKITLFENYACKDNEWDRVLALLASSVFKAEIISLKFKENEQRFAWKALKIYKAFILSCINLYKIIYSAIKTI